MIRINLLPPDLRPQPQVRVRNLLVMFSILLVVFLAGYFLVTEVTRVLGMANSLEKAKQTRAEYSQLYDEIVRMEAEKRAIEKELAAREGLTRGMLAPLTILQDMEEIVPTNLSYNEFMIKSDRQVSLSGLALDYYSVAALQLKLSLSSQYTDIVLESASESADGNGVEFRIDCRLKGEAPAP